MAQYIVKIRTTGHEVYLVDADSEQEAQDIWAEKGHLQVSEVLDADVESAHLDPDTA